MSSPAARSPKDVTPERLHALHEGLEETRTLAEQLAIDFARLYRMAFPDEPDGAAALEALAKDGVTRRMACAGKSLHAALGAEALKRCMASGSDTVRSWGAYALAERQRLGWPALIRAVRGLADDSHFGVREWAWLALRPRLVAEPLAAMEELLPWVGDDSERLRRFAVEALRPRGVWCAHLSLFKTEPERALPLLEPLRADASRYVQDSVANWLNDASKTRGSWVREVCERWVEESPRPETRRIAKRALRTLRKKEQQG